MAKKAGIVGVDQFEKDVLEWASMADEVVSLAPKTITPSVTQSARRGQGPDGVPYPKWSEAYEKRKANASGRSGDFLWGLKKKSRLTRLGQTGHMLDLRNFTWEKLSEEAVQLVWVGSGRSEIYGPVHNEGLGKMPKREWMHLLHPSTLRLIDTMLAKIGGDKTDEFNAKQGR